MRTRAAGGGPAGAKSAVEMRTLIAAVATCLLLTAVAEASAPPVGPLPAGRTQTITAHVGDRVALALPKAGNGLVWRLARNVDQRRAVETGETETATEVIVVYRITGKGQVKVRYALTQGETSKAVRSRTFVLTGR